MEDAQLVSRCLDGDEAAFALLVDQHKLMVYNIVGRMVGRDACDDLAQEAFVQVFRGLHGFRGEAKLSTWVYRITYRVCLERLQRQERSIGQVPLSGGSPDSPQEGPWAAQLAVADPEFKRLEARTDLQRALVTLPAHYRMVLTLFYLQGRRYDEIAQVMEIPLGTVKTYLHRAKARLRECLLDLESEE